MQDENMLGVAGKNVGININQGVTYFSSDTQKGTNYNDYNGSIVESHINNYKTVLESEFGVDVIEARLITQEELMDPETFACVKGNGRDSCKDSPYSWIYSTAYWLGTYHNTTTISVVTQNAMIGLATYDNGFSYGVRPVIEIDVDEIYVQSGARLVNGSLDTIGSEVCIDEECFYIFKNDGTNVSMISKYNLHIGNTYDGTVVPLANPTGIQNEKAIGWFSGRSKTNPIIGNIGFYSYGNIYWSSSVTNYPAYVFNANSPIYSHLQNYKNILINKGANVSNIRLIQVNELVNLGCNISTSSCTSSQYPWLYSTSYWTGSAASSTNVYHVISNGNLNSSITFTDFNAGSDTLAAETAHEILAGARPVIEIPVSEIH